MSDPLLILAVTILAAIIAIALIIWAVRIAQRPRNALLHGGLSPELLTRALELKATDQFDQAVFLVRGETGLSHRAATRLVRKLRPAPPAPPAL
ncbi:hypothetical protein ACWDR1_30345 [Streptosporangium sandarakinum]|uniref:Uncharacterized protein n=1 Tax=Streptosporangium sandarakinum TaxID=1260955 RepID=A0A852UWG1_9ACTN|nr:hypothetical protein [Streptosporangium sandarakinum]NYF41702.1 hypothetical protein [Streptosporangium sandarakinum]